MEVTPEDEIPAALENMYGPSDKGRALVKGMRVIYGWI